MVNDMNEKIDEQLSALIDDELTSHEVNEVLDVLAKDNELRNRWERYHLIRDVMHNDLQSDIQHGLSDRVHEALQSEPTMLAPSRKVVSFPPFMKQVTSFAVAASITAVAILGVQSVTHQNVVTAPQQVASVPDVQQIPGVAPQRVATSPDYTRPASSNTEWTRVSGTRWNLNRKDVELKLNSYLVNHSEYSGFSGMRGLLPYAKIVSYDSNRQE